MATENKRTCTVCGQEVPAEEEGCLNCGTYIGAFKQEPTDESSIEDQSPIEQPPAEIDETPSEDQKPVKQSDEDITESEVQDKIEDQEADDLPLPDKAPSLERRPGVACPYCDKTHPHAVRFCPFTGRRMLEALTCPQCEKNVQPDWVACAFCGHSLHAEEAESTVSPPSGHMPKWVLALAGLLLLMIGLLLGQRLEPMLVVETMVVTGEKTAASKKPTPTASFLITLPPTPMLTQPPDMPPLNASLGDTWTRPGGEVEMVYIPAGKFEMGSETGDNDESPVHTVYLDAFWMDQTEVTNIQFAEFLNDQGNQSEAGTAWFDANDERVHIIRIGGKWQPKNDYEYHPVVKVSWFGARAYCEWVGGRLPTEAEWEEAARGGLEETKYPWGYEDPVCTAGAENGAQYYGCDRQTLPVMNFAPNNYGLYDIAGNVWEWVADWYGEDYYNNSPFENPEGSSSRGFRVVRGGSWGLNEGSTRVANRSRYYPDFLDYDIGFRCATDAVFE